MGRRLIIKDADFSANGIYLPAGEIYDWTDCPLTNSGINSATGELITDSTYKDWVASNYIEVGDNEVLVLLSAPGAQSFGLAFYDESKNFISGVPYKGNASGGTFSIPSNAYYIRFCDSISGKAAKFYLK